MDPDEIPDNQMISADVIIDIITSKCSPSINMDYNKAIAALLAYFHFDTISPEQYLRGECNLSEILDIKIYEGWKKESNYDYEYDYSHDSYDYDDWDFERYDDEEDYRF